MTIAATPTLAISNQSAGARTVRSLREWIRDGQWAAGERVPSEMDLVERLRVSRGTVRTALQQLEAEGLVQELPGRGRKARGRIVMPPRSQAQTGLMARTAVLITHGSGALADDPQLYAAGRAELAVDAAVMQALHASSLHLLCISSLAFKEVEIDHLIAGVPSGVIIGRNASQATHVQPLIDRLADTKIPLITTGHDAEAVRSDRVISDHNAGAYSLTCWLIGQGRKRIVEMGCGGSTSDLGWVKDRTTGYSRAMREHGLAPVTRIYASNVEPGHERVTAPRLQRREAHADARATFERRVRQIAGFVASVALGPNPIDAIMASNDWDASIILAACRLIGLEPNKQVAVVGYDDWWDTEEREWEPARPLATIDKRNAEIGRQAVQMLVERVENRLPAGPQIRRVEPRLVEVPPTSNG